jgi:hypothetical protein
MPPEKENRDSLKRRSHHSFKFNQFRSSRTIPLVDYWLGQSYNEAEESVNIVLEVKPLPARGL